MATTIDAAALLIYRAAWQRDQGRNVTREAAMAKMAATEGAQQVIDAAVQLFGGQGVVSGETVERLYREIRALRIYEGATEVQQLIIARELLKDTTTRKETRMSDERSAAARRLAAAQGLCQRRRRDRPAGLRRRPGGLEPAGRLGDRRLRGADPPGAGQHRRRAAAPPAPSRSTSCA